jgi:hypothetical protein
LVQPAGGVSLDLAIKNADNNLMQLRMTGSYDIEVANLAQDIGLANALQKLVPYFTDLNMTTPSSMVQPGTDLSALNSSINSLGITNPSYKQTLNDLMAILSNAAQSIVFFLNESSFNIAFFNLFKILNLVSLNLANI